MGIELGSAYARIIIDATGAKKGSQEAQQSMNGLTQAGGGLKMAMGAVGLATGIVTGTMFAVSKVVDSTTGEFIKLANGVRTLNQINGDTAENNSRLTQTLDDYKISSEEVIVAQRKLATQNKSISIPALMEMSDAYLKLNTGAERQSFLTENFGRNSAGWAEVMTQGSAAIKARSDSVEDGLILDQKSLDLARKLELQQDATNDSILAAKIAVGEVFTPALIALNKQTVAAISGWKQLFVYFDLVGKNKNADMLERYTNDLTDLHRQQEQAIEDFRMGRIGSDELQTSMANLQGNINADEKALQKLTPALETTTDATQALADGVTNVSEDLTDYGQKISAITNFTSNYDENVKKLAEAEKAAEDARKTYGINSEQYKSAIQNVRDLQTASAEQTKQWISDQLLQRLSQDGLTKDEYQYYLDYLVQAGEMTKAARNHAIAAWGVVDALERLASKKITIEIDTIRRDTTFSSTGPYQPTMHTTPKPGTGMVDPTTHAWVPPVYLYGQGGSTWVNEPTLFMAGENGPEKAEFTPLSKAGGSSGMNITVGPIYIQGDASESDVRRGAETGVLEALRAKGLA
jgi:hypothetical protein